MAILDRWVMKLRPGKLEEYKELLPEFIAVSQRLGEPTTRYYSYISGPHDMGTVVSETLWESHAEREAYWQMAVADPEWQAAAKPFSDIMGDSIRVEYLELLA